VAYLDGPGGSQTPDSVARAVAGYLTSANANCDGSFVTSEQADRMLDEARFAVADSLGCGPDEIVSGAQALPPEACRLIRL
jgi:selenocysteine lyase/cysteine desulfurase